MSVGDRPPGLPAGLPRRPSPLAGPFGSAESPTTSSLSREDHGLRVSSTCNFWNKFLCDRTAKPYRFSSA